MSTQNQLALASMSSDFPALSPYGKANPRRGANHVDAAIAFLEDFPIGTALSPEKFDEWAQRKGLLNVPTGAVKSSDAWLAHLQRRHQLHYNINRAASHPRMDVPFAIEFVREGMWEVRAPHVAISKSKMIQRLETLCGTHRRQLNYLMQSADWSILPPYERIVAESLYDDIDALQKQIEMQGQGLSRKFAKLETKLRKAVESGAIRPKNGGIKAILEHKEVGRDGE